MGYINNHAVVFTVFGYAAEGVQVAIEAWARDVDTIPNPPFNYRPSVLLRGPVVGLVNDSVSFAFLPDGSKEGWDTSDLGDEARRRLVEVLESFRYEDGSSPVRYIEVSYDEQDRKQVVR